RVRLDTPYRLQMAAVLSYSRPLTSSRSFIGETPKLNSASYLDQQASKAIVWDQIASTTLYLLLKRRCKSANETRYRAKGVDECIQFKDDSPMLETKEYIFVN